MSNNQAKKIAALHHNVNRNDMKCPNPPKDLPANVQMIQHDDIIEFTQFDTEAMTFTKRFDSLCNGKHTTLPFEPVIMESYNELSEELIRAQARMKFIQHCKEMIIH